ncbi:MAG: tetraacyldisaccharide 4'-kinase [Magnetococcales bacterium]|nr:tetraacyldisaccharide 4'-kinase [Magnetococcales bacterium]
MTLLITILAGERPPNGFLERTVIWVLKIIGHLYGLIQTSRAYLYKKAIIKTYAPPCAVVSVGNITAGGTGKTPTVIWLAKYFQSRGRKVGVVSRGYRQHSKDPVTVVADPKQLLLTPPQAADEAVLIAKKLPGVTVITGPNRQKTIKVATQDYGCNIVIMDDAFQHMQVKRQLDLVLLDCNYPFSNGNILPGGLLRESPQALNRCDGIILTRADNHDKLQASKEMLKLVAPNIPICHAIHKKTGWLKLVNNGADSSSTLSLDELKEIPVLAFCGIAKPEAFRNTLETTSLSVIAFETFTDHHVFTENTIDQIIEHAVSLNAQAVVCTEKDMVKITEKEYALPIYALSMELFFPNISPWLQHKLDLI